MTSSSFTPLKHIESSYVLVRITINVQYIRNFSSIFTFLRPKKVFFPQFHRFYFTCFPSMLVHSLVGGECELYRDTTHSIKIVQCIRIWLGTKLPIHSLLRQLLCVLYRHNVFEKPKNGERMEESECLSVSTPMCTKCWYHFVGAYFS